LFGVELPGCFGAIEVGSSTTTLFVPRQPDAYAVWMGAPPTLDELKETYAVDAVRYVEELSAFLSSKAPSQIYEYGGENSDSGSKGEPAKFEGRENYQRESTMLHRGLHEARVVKSAAEVEILRFANKIASAAHREVMRHCKPGMMEYQLESIFRHHCYMHGGMRNTAYTPIAGSGPNAAVLHYGHAGACLPTTLRA
jgi:Xaa-Pro dipeptidase